MEDIIVIGSINIDFVTEVDHIPKKGETIIGNNFKRIPGGKGANQAVAAARLGGKVKMVGKVGQDDTGDFLIRCLESNGVNIEQVHRSKDKPTGTALIQVEKMGDNSIVVIPGANYEVGFEEVDFLFQNLNNAKILIAQMEIPTETIKYAFSKAKENGIFTILNPAPAAPIKNELIHNIDLLTPNETELELLSGISIKTEDDVRRAANSLLDQGIKALIITLGEKGSIYIDKKGCKKYPIYEVEVKDTTAAGDSFTAAIAVALSENKSIDEMMDFAAKVGALTVTKFGAQDSLPLREAVDHFK